MGSKTEWELVHSDESRGVYAYQVEQETLLVVSKQAVLQIPVVDNREQAGMKKKTKINK